MNLFGREHHHHDSPWDEAPPWAIELREMGLIILQNQETLMATLDEVLSDVTAETTAIQSLAALIDGLRQQVKDALSGVTLPPDAQAKVDAIFTAAETNKAAIAKALAANTPAPPA
jgi:hypothetical protein